MRRGRLLLAAAVVVAGLVYLVVGGIRGAIVYYITPSELVAQGAQIVGRPVRVGGQVRAGSRQWDAQANILRFVLTDGQAAVPVEYRGAPPALFTEGQGAVVEGSLDAAGLFRARAVIVRHNEEYRPPAAPSPAGLSPTGPSPAPPSPAPSPAP